MQLELPKIFYPPPMVHLEHFQDKVNEPALFPDEIHKHIRTKSIYLTRTEDHTQFLSLSNKKKIAHSLYDHIIIFYYKQYKQQKKNREAV